ncbi:MAG: DUF499 domain-containing protein [Candidatus Cyclonatronum sp.]|uniref:DUF499 domain-containing protein n=1 Tax=Cyclonatronum sp. TaxID=3024185 RepID=UPI0025BEAA14|nr:DUF499 domain-containing protein [Cyclonatronum sp.]MCH8487879.1 DUF499 domain-containing protein [Cyclonatronum sp.]
MKTLRELLQPRPTVLNNTNTDIVLNLDLLSKDKIDPHSFFEENYVTKGMADLYRYVFQKFEHKDDAFLFMLKQSMGGGKTHNLIALGLLAKYPTLREKYMKESYDTSVLDAIKVVTVNGRDNHNLGIWGTIAEQIGKSQQFNSFYQPLKAPGRNAWLELLKGEKLLIMMDELPPYIYDLQSQPIGGSTLADVTTTALANLFNAASELKDIVIIITDLEAEFAMDGLGINQALINLQDESKRFTRLIEPVNQSSSEVYQILGTRLFEKLPPKEEVLAIAESYAQALKTAKQAGLYEGKTETIKKQIETSYPFHPATRDLMARFKENKGFQKTRGLIRFWRVVLNRMFHETEGWADDRYLIHPYDIDLNHTDTRNIIADVNKNLDNALSHDIADQGNAVAEKIADQHNTDLPIKISKLILFSSLSTITNQTKGLKRHEIIYALAGPDIQLDRVYEFIGDLRQSSWYIHQDAAENILYKHVQNVVSKMNDFEKSFTTESNKQQARIAIAELFKPHQKDLYDKVLTLPGLNEITLSADQLLLVISDYQGSGLNPELKEKWEQDQFRNRLIVISGDPAITQRIYSHIARLRALENIFNEFQTDNVPATDPQYKEADDLKGRAHVSFLSAVTQAFTTVYYPTKERNGEFIKKNEIQLQFSDNRLNGEEQVRQLLISNQKFYTDLTSDTFRKEAEAKLFGGQTSVPFTELRKRAAQYTHWPFHHPRGLESLRDTAVQKGFWKNEGSNVNKGPFEKEKTSVLLQPKTRDANSGYQLVTLKPIHGDKIYWEIGKDVTEASSPIDDLSEPFKIQHMVVSFLCVDTSGAHKTGQPVVFQNTLDIKYSFTGTGDERYCELKSVPDGAKIKYTTDDSDPASHGGIYEDRFIVPANATVIRAIASLESVNSDPLTATVPKGKNVITIDDSKSYAFNFPTRLDSTRDIFEWLEKVGHIDLIIEAFEYAVVNTVETQRFAGYEVHGIELTLADIKTHIETIRALFSFETKLTLRVNKLRFMDIPVHTDPLWR